MVILKYTTHKVNHELSGVITAATRKHVLFLVNNDKTADEINLSYDAILDISIPERKKAEQV